MIFCTIIFTYIINQYIIIHSYIIKKGFVIIIDENGFEHKISLARNSQDINILKKLKNDFSAVIRKTVAQNIHTTKELLNELAFDSVLNVSYLATKHPNCVVVRNFEDTNHPCIRCKDDFRKIENCNNCKKLSSFNY